MDVTGRTGNNSSRPEMLWTGVYGGAVLPTLTPLMLRLRDGIVVEASHNRMVGLIGERGGSDG